MTDSEELQEALTRALQKSGRKAVKDALLALEIGADDDATYLTIVGNGGMHAIPESCIHGELYTVTRGTLDMSQADAINDLYILLLRPLAEKLREKAWKKIYLVPTGPTTLALQIKLLVYHITRISTIDLLYEKGRYYEINLDYRSYLK